MGSKNKITIEEGYKRYLKLVNLDLDKMSEVQKKETKRAYYAGYSTALVDNQEVILEGKAQVAFEFVDDLQTEAHAFWEAAQDNKD